MARGLEYTPSLVVGKRKTQARVFQSFYKSYYAAHPRHTYPSERACVCALARMQYAIAIVLLRRLNHTTTHHHIIMYDALQYVQGDSEYTLQQFYCIIYKYSK